MKRPPVTARVPIEAGSGAGSTAERWARPSGGWAWGWARCCACVGRGPRRAGGAFARCDSHRARFPVSYACLFRGWCSQPVAELFIDSCQLFFFIIFDFFFPDSTCVRRWEMRFASLSSQCMNVFVGERFLSPSDPSDSELMLVFPFRKGTL